MGQEATYRKMEKGHTAYNKEILCFQPSLQHLAQITGKPIPPPMGGWVSVGILCFSENFWDFSVLSVQG